MIYLNINLKEYEYKRILKVYKFKINLRGYSLIGKTAILHIVILGSSPNISNVKFK